MKLIIDIDENLYTRLFDNGVDNYDDAVDMAKVIRKGIPLDKISDEIYENYINDDLSYQCQCGLGLALNIIGKYVGEQE